MEKFIVSDSEDDSKSLSSDDDDTDKAYHTYDDMECLASNLLLLKGIYEYGFTNPSPIQSKSIMEIYKGGDMIAQARSGSGKTGAYSIGLLSKINVELLRPQGLILVNTKELAKQVELFIKNISKNMGIKIELCVGGNEISTDTNIKNGIYTHILIGTPGRILDMLLRNNKHKLKLLQHLKVFIIDEADKLLSHNFINQTEDIIKQTPKSAQICLFSATYTNEIKNITTNFLKEPKTILIKDSQINVPAIKHYKINTVDDIYKYDTLLDIYKMMNICQVVIFVNSIKTCDLLYNKMTADDFAVDVIHSQLTQTERNDVISKFLKSQIRVLIATDLIARGIDVQSVGLVINYELPLKPEEYIHRIGRCGRYGKKGIAINLINNHEIIKIKELENKYKIHIEDLPSDESTITKYILNK